MVRSTKLKDILEVGDRVDLPLVQGRNLGQADAPFKCETQARAGCRVIQLDDKRVILESPLGGRKIRLLWSSFNSNKWIGSFTVHKTISVS